MLADRAVDRDILLGDRGGAIERGGEAKLRWQMGQRAAHFGQRPGEVDRGRAGRAEYRGGAVERRVRRVLGDRERHAVGGGRADQRGPAHLHVADRARRLVEPGQPRDDQLVRQ